MNRFLLIVVFALVPSIIFSADYHPGKIVIKYESGYHSLDEDLKDNIGKILGKFDLDEFAGENNLGQLRKLGMQNLLPGSKISEFQRKINSLSRIYIANYQSSADALMAAAKISSLPGIEYAEPIYIREIDDIPNDTLRPAQYYLDLIRAPEAIDYLAQKFPDGTDTVIVGVVDTGVFMEHPDLEQVIYARPGETGLDENMNDKRDNGIDDDGNGYVDDWRGWDFGGESGESQDNNPNPGHGHGTHVAGIIAATADNVAGIAGIARNVKILPVKIGYDFSLSRTIVNTYEGLLYAALAGAEIINCSWGGGGYSESEQEIVDMAVELGVLIIAAAGNDGRNMDYYPAAYDGVVSVAATDSDDEKAGFSNYAGSVDLSAPGVDIMSTIPLDNYAEWDGTSMASPVAAGVAAMIWASFPSAGAGEIAGRLKATSDDIYFENVLFTGLLGAGRVNALKAVSEENPVYLEFAGYEISDENSDGIYSPGERITINFEINNPLSEIENSRLFVYYDGFENVELIKSEIFTGALERGQKKLLGEAIEIRLPEPIPVNYEMNLVACITDDENFKTYSGVRIIAHPSYMTMRGNDIELTITSQGNIAYNDFPANEQGDGYRFRGGNNLLFEGSLMIGVNDSTVVNSARRISGRADRDFRILEIISVDSAGSRWNEYSYARFITDSFSLEPSFEVVQQVWQYGGERNDFAIVSYDIINRTGVYHDSLFAGLYFDWDIGPSGMDNKAWWNAENRYGAIRNIEADTLPICAVKLLSGRQVNFFAIDNDGDTTTNLGVYDGFSDSEKWRSLSSGIGRAESGTKDVSYTIGAGPLTARPDDTVRVAFAILNGFSEGELAEISETIEMIPLEEFNPDGSFSSYPLSARINRINPLPAGSSSEIMAEFSVNEPAGFTLSIYDASGRFLQNIFSGRNYLTGNFRQSFSMPEAAAGLYFLGLESGKSFHSVPFVIVE